MVTPLQPLVPLANSAAPSKAQLAGAVEAEGNSAFWNILRFLSRPGFAARSILAGDPEGAVRNLGQMAIDLPTGGFLNRNFNLASIANVFLPEDYELPEELTTREQRPEFTDVLDKWGWADKKSLGWGSRLALDIAGGIVTDPLSYVTGGIGGAAKGTISGVDDVARGVAKAAGKEIAEDSLPSALRGFERLTGPSQANLVEVLRQSPKGSSLLDDTINKIKFTREAPGPLGRSLDMSSMKAGAAIEKRAAEDIFKNYARGTSTFDEGLTALEKANLIPTKGGMYLRSPIPLSKTRSEGPIATNVWSTIGKFGTAPGWAMQALEKTNPAAAGLIQSGAKGLLDKVRGNFFDKAFRNLKDPVTGKDYGPLAREASERVNLRMSNRQTTLYRQGLEAFEWTELTKNEEILDDVGRLAFGAQDEFVRLSKFDEVVDGLQSMPRTPGTGPVPMSSLKHWGPLQTFAKDVADGIEGSEDALKQAKDLLETLRGKVIGKKAREAVRDYAGDFEWLGRTFTKNGRAWENGGVSFASALEELRNAERAIVPGMSRFARKQAIETRKLAMLDVQSQAKHFFDFYGWERGIRDLNGKALRNARNADLADILQTKLSLDPAAARARADHMFDIWDSARAKRAEELVEVGLWPHKELVNPFQVSHQTTDLFYKLMEGGFVDKGFAKHYFKGRKSVTSQEFRTALVDIAKKAGIDVAEEAVQETNALKLFINQGQAHASAMAVHELKNELVKLGMPKPSFNPVLNARAEAHPLNVYLKNQFKGMSERGASKILGGGRIGFNSNQIKDKHVRDGFVNWAKSFDPDSSYIRRGVDDAGNVTVDFRGLNFLYKPLMTVVAPAFHIRNNIGAQIMGLTDPDLGIELKRGLRSLADQFEIGAKGFGQAVGKGSATLGDAISNGRVVNTLTKMGASSDDMAAWLKYTSTDITEHLAGKAALEAANPTFGKYNWKQVAKAVDAVAGPSIMKGGRNMADLMADLPEHLDVFGRELTANGPALSKAYKNVVKVGYDIADITERRFRGAAVMELMAKGVSPTKAIRRVNRAFVNYNINSETERLVRDLIPFAKFAMHSTVWAKNIAENPSLVTWMARARGGIEEGEFLPESAEDSLALPLWWKDKDGNQAFLTSLGIPLETTLNMLGAPTSAQGFRRRVLAGINPVVRTPLEHATNRSFYFGDEFGTFRKPPASLPSFLTKEITLPDGTKRYEIPGEINEMIKSMPFSRLSNMVDKILHEKRPAWDKALNLLTGARTMTVNQERELKTRLQDYLKDKAQSGEVGETLVYFNRMEEAKMPEDLKIVMAGLKGIRDKKRQEKKNKPVGLRGLAR